LFGFPPSGHWFLSSVGRCLKVGGGRVEPLLSYVHDPYSAMLHSALILNVKLKHTLIKITDISTTMNTTTDLIIEACGFFKTRHSD